MIKNVVKFLLVAVILLPLGVNASKKIVEFEDFDSEIFLEYAGRIKTGYSGFVLVDRDYEDFNNDVFYSFDWNKNKTVLSNFDIDTLKAEETKYDYLPGPSGGIGAATSGELAMEEDSSNPGSYRYCSSFKNVFEHCSSEYKYSSASTGESIGSLFADDLKIYELVKTTGGADYVTNTGKIVFSTQSNDDTGYFLIANNTSVITFKNDTKIIIYDYIDRDSESRLLEEVINAKLESLLKTDDLTGISLTINIGSTKGGYYFEVLLNNKSYFINSDVTKILHQRDVNANEICYYYGIKYNNKEYVFADVYDLSKSVQISTDLFDLEGNKYYDDSEWLRLEFSGYDSLYGVKKIDNKYYAIFMYDDGTEIYRRDITDLDKNGSSSNFYGEILTSDHETDTIDDGKYLVQFTNDNYDESFFIKYEIMTVLSNYKIIEGVNQKYTLGDNKNIVLKIDANKDLFSKLYVNDTELDSSNYTVAKGSTIITLSSDYLNTLEKGTYELKATFTNNETVTTQLIIDAAEINPKTGDRVISSVLLGIVSLVGLLGTSLYLKKKI